MKNLENIKKATSIIAVLIIMIGAIVVATAGFKFGLEYQAHKRIEIYIDKDYSIEDVKNIINEVVPNEKIIVQNVETFNEDVSFTIKNISDEQTKSLQEKINTKYEMAESTESIIVIDEPHMKLTDIMKPYVKPLIISTIIICLYLAIRFKKAGLFPIATIIISQALYYSVWAICRIPVSKITMPISLLVYVIAISGVTIALGKSVKTAKQ